MPDNSAEHVVRRIVADAGEELVGRIRLQKIVYLMNEAGFTGDFSFVYHHYGPYSEDLEKAVEQACDAGLIDEKEKMTDWGTPYYIYKAESAKHSDDLKERDFVQCAKAFPSVVLELAATALFLRQREGFDGHVKDNAWLETERRKKFKAREGRLRQAFQAYEALRAMSAERELPIIPFPC